MPDDPVTVILADPHPMLRLGVRTSLEAADEFAVVEVADSDSLLEKTAALGRHAIALVDLDLPVADVLDASIVAHEIQGVLALENAFNRVGLDHVVLVKVASTAARSRGSSRRWWAAPTTRRARGSSQAAEATT